MAMTFDIDRLPVRAVGGVSLGGLIVKTRFGMSAPQAQNGFAGERIVSSQAPRRNIRGENAKDFNMRKIGAIQEQGQVNSSARHRVKDGRFCAWNQALSPVGENR
ncbi:MAG TPA: hypothetical protein VJR30_24365 [Bradyrhizobium sp.]|nr:hypothetical protein [Bradyrhizobium sp.]